MSPGAIGPLAPPTSSAVVEPSPKVDRGVVRSLGDAGFARDDKGNMVYREPAGHFIATLLPDGRVRFKERFPKPTKTQIRLPDLYRRIRKAQGGELWARDKALLLERTFELRLAIAIEFAERNIDRRIKALYRDLLDIWSASERPAVARRKTLFERWDECDDTMKVALPGFEGSQHSRIDALRQGAGRRARDEITGFIRKHLAKGTPEAYASDELAELNQRRVSRERFAPYDARPGDGPEHDG